MGMSGPVEGPGPVEGLGLRDGAVSGDGDPAAAQEMHDVHAAFPARAAHLSELFRWPLPPGGHHVPIVVPGATERFPVTGVPGNHPRFYNVSDGNAISKVTIHEFSFPAFRRSDQ